MTIHSTHSFRILAVATVAFSILISATSQDAEDKSQIKFTARTDLVLIPTIVTEKSGNHITGLKKEDFTVQENGAEQQIDTFEEICTDQRPLLPPANSTEFSNFVGGEQSSTSRLTLIVLDLINTPFAAQAAGRQELLKYLMQSLDGREPTALYTLTRGGLQVIHDFTADPRILVAALREVKGDAYQIVDSAEDAAAANTGTASPSSRGNPEAGASNSKSSANSAVQGEAASIQSFLKNAELSFQSFEQFLAINYTLDGMQQIAQALAGYPGRKSLIWVSGGFPFGVSANTMKLASTGRVSLADVLPLYEHTWQLLNAAEISLYPVDVKGLQVVTVPSASVGDPGKNPGKNSARHAITRNLDTQSTLQTFASMTGGRAYYNSNDLVKGFRDAVNDSSQYYLLGYYLDHSDTKPGWRKLAVRVKRDHTEVRARTGFFVTNTTVDPESTRKIDISSALMSSLDYTSLELVERWGKTEAAKDSGQKYVSYELHFSPKVDLINASDNNHLALDIVTLAFTADGRRGGDPVAEKIDLHLSPERAAVIRKQGLTFREVVNLAPGEYKIRFVVRDYFTGRTGSVAAPLKVE